MTNKTNIFNIDARYFSKITNLKVRLLSFFQIAMFVLGIVVAITHLFTFQKNAVLPCAERFVLFAGIIIPGLFWFINKKGHHIISFYGTIVFSIFTIFIMRLVPLSGQETFASITYLIFSIFLGTILLPVPFSLILSGLILSILFLLQIISNSLNLDGCSCGYFVFSIFATVFLSVSAIYCKHVLKSHIHELKIQKERFKTICECTTDALIILDNDDIITYASFIISQFTDLSIDKLIGCKVYDLVLKDDIETIKNALTRAHKTQGEPVKINNLLVHLKNGEQYYIFAKITNVSNNTAVDETIITIRDVSEQKLLEEQLHHSDKMQAIGQLAGGIAHDFNNRLVGIMGLADLINITQVANDKICKYSAQIVIESKKASDLTSKLLAFARKGKFLSQPINLHETIEDVINLLKHSIDKKILIKRQFNATYEFTKGDPTQLENLFLNIALNARDSMPNGGTITIKTEIVICDKDIVTPQDTTLTIGDFIKVSVIDTGTGISQKTIGHIFEPFFTTKEYGKGSGMGLAAAYGTAKCHNGTITVNSEIGHGSTFAIYLPVEHNIKPKPKTIKSSDLKKGTGHILVVDDKQSVCDMLQIILEKIGYTVTICKSGIDAIEYVSNNKQDISLVILDMVMPGKSGKETFSELISIRTDLRILLCTGYALDTDTMQLIKDGAKGFIQKPFTIIDISQAVANALSI